ncbi:MAG: hypothetical protein IPO99_18470 [Nitrospira sp.]|nr:hypothetical protein [Nitrospira sp.]
MAIDDRHVTVNGIRNVPLKGSWPVATGFRLNQPGHRYETGTPQLDPGQAALTLKLAHIGLQPFQLPPTVACRLKSETAGGIGQGAGVSQST